MPNLIDQLLPYVPALISSQITKSRHFPEQPSTEKFKAASLFADISGFTSITEKLAAQGPQGVELLSRILNDYFGRLTCRIAEHGGDVVNFAGDSLLAVWRFENEEETGSILETVLQCAHRIQKELHGYEPRISAKLSLRVGVGLGEARIFYLGGVQDNWEFILNGDAIAQAHYAEKIATPGEIILSSNVWDVVKQTTGYLGSAKHGNILLSAVPNTSTPQPIHPFDLSEDSEAALQRFVPLTIITRLIAGQSDWLAELRRTTAVFINLQDFNNTTSLEHAGEVIHAIQKTAFHFEGFLNKIGMDEKGVSPLMIFGAPPFAHEDDPIRAVMAAQEISRKLTALSQPHSIGITTGRAFCGAVGGAERREYAVIGDVINTSARLMQAAALVDQLILCDSATQQAAGQKVRFSPLEPIQLKGKSEPLPVFHPINDLDSSQRAHREDPVVGRAFEKNLLREGLLRTTKDSSKSIIILEGEAGIGKSRLLEYVQKQADEAGGTSLICEADAVEKNTSYFSWRGTFRKLLGLDSALAADERKEKVLLHLPAKWHERAALLNPILGLDFDEPILIREMSGEVRAENTRALLIELLQDVAQKPLTIIMEDAHWQDSASWALTLEVSRLISPLFLLIATRPIGDKPPSQYRSLLANEDTQRLSLGPLSPDEALLLVEQRLNINDLPEDMAHLIRTKAEGNPFFSEELAYSLRDSGLIQIENNTCRVMPGVNLKTFSFPDTVQGVVTSRIDRLSPQEQLCVKVASVIGRIFTYRVLHDIHPIHNDRQYLESYLGELEQLDLTPLETPNPELTYVFKHAITQDVAYNLMLFAQRQELHSAIAEWYEVQFADDLSPLYAALAHHWRYSGDNVKALQYLELAAQQALENFANHEAVDFLNLILGIEAKFPIKDNLRKARWERQLGQAYKGLSDMETSRTHLQNALRLMGHPIPHNAAGWILQLLGQLIRRMILPIRELPGDSNQAEEIKETLLAFEALSEIYYYAIDLPPFLACLVRMLNIVDKLGVSPEMARSYSVTALVAGLIPLHGVAKRYEKRALEIMDTLGQFEGLAFAMSGLSLYNMGIGEFKQAFQNMTRAVESVTFLNNRPRMAEVFTTMAQVHQRLGNYSESMEYFERAWQTGLREENPQHQVWGLNGKAGILLYQGGEGHTQEAIDLLNRSIPLLVGATDHTEDIRAYGQLGIAHLRIGHTQAALHFANLGLGFILTTSPTAHDALEGYAGVAETCLHLLESNPQDKELSRSTRKALKGLLKCGQLFPVAMPRYWCLQGWYEMIQRRNKQAEDCWAKGLELARKLDMTYEEARLLYEKARHEPAANQTDLGQAAKLFTTLGAGYELEKINALNT
jgi:class 3 adenylate cyclase/tetratricopeptide (TPR) repeat protein